MLTLHVIYPLIVYILTTYLGKCHLFCILSLHLLFFQRHSCHEYRCVIENINQDFVIRLITDWLAVHWARFEGSDISSLTWMHSLYMSCSNDSKVLGGEAFKKSYENSLFPVFIRAREWQYDDYKTRLSSRLKSFNQYDNLIEQSNHPMNNCLIKSELISINFE